MTVLGKDATTEFHLYHKAAPVFAKYDSRLVVGILQGADIAKEYATEGVFGDGIAFGDPAWYQEWKTPYYTDSHRRLKAWARKVVEEEVIPHVAKWEEEGSVPRSLYKRFGELGFLSGITGVTPWPSFAPNAPPVGIKPGEWDVFHELVLGDELARCASSGVASAITLGPSIALPPIIHFAAKHLQEKILKPVLSGDKTIALAITEPYAGSDVANITATAVSSPDGKHYIVNGEKKWIVSCPIPINTHSLNRVWADFFVVAVRTGKKGMGEISLVLAERGMPRFSTGPIKCQGQHWIRHGIPHIRLIGEENKGFWGALSLE
ncbi:hypothetical protein HDU96_010168 [Phlyctochytrium bullatum]|nr:hypothetical protein HDU96_010168 [Phlyctochytrium bullatum]